jgi:hypothetical protein
VVWLLISLRLRRILFLLHHSNQYINFFQGLLYQRQPPPRSRQYGGKRMQRSTVSYLAMMALDV